MPDAVVYLAHDSDDRLLYVGATRDFYRRQELHSKTKTEWLPLVARWKVQPQPTWEDACALEAKLIRELSPRYNRRGGFRSRPAPHPYREAQLAQQAAWDERIIELRRQGKTRWEIMQELGLSHGKATTHLKRLLREGRIERRPSGQPTGYKPARRGSA